MRRQLPCSRAASFRTLLAALRGELDADGLGGHAKDVEAMAVPLSAATAWWQHVTPASSTRTKQPS